MTKQQAIKKIRKITVISVLISFFIFGIIYGFIEHFYNTLPSLKPLDQTDIDNIHYWGLPSKIYSQEGVLLAEFYKEKREIIEYEDIPTSLINAIISIEDKEFFSHTGINFRGVARAFLTNLSRGWATQGGSSLTQQLAKVLFLTPQKTITRKIREALLAVKIELELTKEEILERYFNKIYFGHSAYGVETASRIYFGKSATELSIGEASLIAGLPKAPNTYSPLKNPTLAKRRQMLVLNEMVREGFITNEKKEIIFEEFWNEFKTLDRAQIESDFKTRTFRAPYFVEYIKKELIKMYGTETVFHGGLKVNTTINLKYQEAAEKVVAERLEQLNSQREMTEELKTEKIEGSLIALDTNNGDILAMVGGSKWALDNQLNRTVQIMRQPGSLFKPFVFLTAFKMGLSPAYTIYDAPITLDTQRYEDDWRPVNYSGNYYGDVTLREALVKSLNVSTIKLMEIVEAGPIIETAKQLEIKSPLRPYWSMALGAFEIRPLEIVNSFIPFTNKGLYYPAQAINNIYNRQNVEIYSKTTIPKQVLEPEYSFLITHILKGVTQPGGTAASIGRTVNRPIAGKTGTTNKFRDAWFIGWTPSIIAGIWVGYDKGNLHLGQGNSGGSAAAPIFADFINNALANEPIEYFNETPNNIIFKDICNTSGKLATPNCPTRINEAFIQGTEPTENCDKH
jgi:1A family penicillin-binding protein